MAHFTPAPLYISDRCCREWAISTSRPVCVFSRNSLETWGIEPHGATLTPLSSTAVLLLFHCSTDAVCTAITSFSPLHSPPQSTSMTQQQPGSYDATYTKPTKALIKLPEARLPNGSPVDFGNGHSGSQAKPRSRAKKSQKASQPKPADQPQAQSQTKNTDNKKKAKSVQPNTQSIETDSTKKQQKKSQTKNKATKKLPESPLSSPDLKHPQVSGNNYTVSNSSSATLASSKKAGNSAGSSGSGSYAGHSFTNAPDVAALPKPSFL